MLILGDEVYGFDCGSLNMTPEMYEVLGKVGVVVAVVKEHIKLKFFDDTDQTWWYPREEAENHLVDKFQNKVQFKKFHQNAKLPQKMTEGAACMDVFATEIEKVEDDYYICKLGIGVTPPKGHKVVLVPRSSLTKTRWMIINTPCQGDEDFYHEYQLRFRAFPRGIMHGDVQHLYYDEFPFKVGERIGQIFIEKVLDFEWVEVDELKETSRLGGYGSTNV